MEKENQRAELVSKSVSPRFTIRSLSLTKYVRQRTGFSELRLIAGLSECDPIGVGDAATRPPPLAV